MSGRNPFSSSRLGKLYLCSGSHYMELGLPEEQSQEAETGNTIHAAVAHGDGAEREQALAALSDSGRELAEKWVTVSGEFFGSYPVWHEVPLKLTDGEGTVLTTGTADVLGRAGTEVRVADLKTGWGELDPVSLTFQLTTYLAMALERCERAQIAYGLVYQPALERRYEVSLKREKLPETREAVRRVIERAEALPIQLSPHPAACRYCRARSFCPGPRSIGTELTRVVEPRLLSVGQAGALMHRWKVVKRCGEALEAYVRELAGRRTPGLGWYIRAVAGNRQLTSTREAYERLREVIDAESFLDLATVPVTRLEEEYVRRSIEAGEHLSKAAARRAFAQIMRGVVERGPDKHHLTPEEDS